jgi:mono/diheme cytochrome c family protein
MMTVLKTLAVAAVLAVLGALTFLYSGLYSIGADNKHFKVTHWALETLRERSIAREIRGMKVPPLNDPQLLLAGGQDYNDMCSGCHLQPGKTQSDLNSAMYPQPPNLSLQPAKGLYGDANARAARHFWYIKHGIKASGMPAWGLTHTDERIWAMVAFIQKLPTLTPEQYQILTAPAEGAADEPMAGM